MKTKTAVGFYGKLPMLGDFVSRQLPYEFITPWDTWLQNAMQFSRAQLGDDWLNSYLASPLWRFVLSAGVCGNSAYAGVMMPSVDKVGRYFPLTVVAPFNQSTHLPHLFTLGAEWFTQLERIALKGLDGDISFQDFEQLIQGIQPFVLPDSDDNHISEAFIGLNTHLAQSTDSYSLWSNNDDEAMHLKVLVYHELPPIKTFCSFLHGNVVDKAIDSDAVFVALSTDADTDPTEPPYLNLLDHLFSENMSNQDSIPTTKSLWQSWAVTDTGKRRKRNEDAILNKPESGLWVVADGMGGHDAGDVASQLIVDTLATVSPSECLETAINSVKNSLCQINTQLIELAKQRNSHIIGSTVVVLAAVENRYAVLWAGDSRLYRLRNQQLQQLTRDHCPDYGLVSNEWTVKIANEITRAVGAGDELDLDCEIDNLLEGDIFLLCSDGLDKELSLKEIEQIMLTNPHDEITNTLLKLTLQRGARDNVSIITICT